MLAMASKLYDYTPDELQELLDKSNSYSDFLRHIGLNPKGGNPKTLKKIIEEYDLDETKLNENRHNLYVKCAECTSKSRKSYSLEDILNGKYPNYQSGKLLTRLIEAGYKERKCEKCGITEWMGKELVFHLHHKDGKHNNNKFDNLEILCPNCHSQTDNFAGKSNRKNTTSKIISDKHGEPKVSREEIFKIMETNSYNSAADLLGVDKETVSRWHKYYTNKEREKGNMIIGSDKAPLREELKEKIRTMSFVQIGKEYNVSDNAVRRWCDTYGLPRHVSEIKSFSDEEWEKI